jgi:hypothetical protein
MMTIRVASLKKQGLAMFPVNKMTIPRMASVAAFGMAGFYVAAIHSYVQLGDKQTLEYMNANKSAILRGEMPMN